jgi:hypothetical protein
VSESSNSSILVIMIYVRKGAVEEFLFICKFVFVVDLLSTCYNIVHFRIFSKQLLFFTLFLSSAGNRHGGGKISASGGDGLAGGGGGRVSINVFSRHDDTQIFVHGNFKFTLIFFF